MRTWEDYRQTMVVPRDLCSAARVNDLASIVTLLAGGADIEAPDPRGYTPLMLAAYNGHVQAVELLIARGANPNARDRAGNSVLMGATFKGHVELVERLLRAGADARAQNAAGIDAQGIAEQFGRAEVMPVLAGALAHGADSV